MPGAAINAYIINMEDILKQEDRAKTIPGPWFGLQKKTVLEGHEG